MSQRFEGLKLDGYSSCREIDLILSSLVVDGQLFDLRVSGGRGEKVRLLKPAAHSQEFFKNWKNNKYKCLSNVLFNLNKQNVEISKKYIKEI